MNSRTYSIALLFVFGACSSVEDVIPENQNNALSGDPCLDLAISHSLEAVGEYQAQRITTVMNGSMSGQPSGIYRISGGGDAVSETLSRGRTDFEFTYNPVSQELSGTFTTHFYFGEVFEMQIDAIAGVRYEQQSLLLTVPVAEAQLHTKAEVRSFVTGEILLEIPTTPTGNISLAASSLATLCLQIVE